MLREREREPSFFPPSIGTNAYIHPTTGKGKIRRLWSKSTVVCGNYQSSHKASDSIRIGKVETKIIPANFKFQYEGYAKSDYI